MHPLSFVLLLLFLKSPARTFQPTIRLSKRLIPLHYKDSEGLVRLGKRDVVWEERMDQLRRYRNVHGDCFVENHKDEVLFNWTRSVRHNHKRQVLYGERGVLSHERLQDLREVGFIWSVQDYKWNQSYNQLQAYHDKYGTVGTLKKEFRPELAQWLRIQIRNHRLSLAQNDTSILPPHRLNALMDLGVFDSYIPQAQKWNNRYKELEAFVKEHGHANVPFYNHDNLALSRWVMNQRCQYKLRQEGKPSHLTLDRIDALESIGFCWHKGREKWNIMYNELVQYQQEHGHVILKNDTDRRELNSWLSRQRKLYYRKQHNYTVMVLPDDRIKALESVPNFTWRSPRIGPRAPSVTDWANLFERMEDLGISKDSRPKQYWFEGQTMAEQAKEVYTEQDLFDLWNQEDDE